MNLCFVHGLPLHYDSRSGFEMCSKCEEINEAMTRKQLKRRQAELNRNKLRYTLSGTERAIRELARIDRKLERKP